MASPVKMMYVRATGQMSLKHTTFLSFGTGDDSGLLKAGGVFTMEYWALVRKVGRMCAPYSLEQTEPPI